MLIRFSHRDGLTNNLVNADNVVLSDSSKIYGLKDTTTNAIILPPNTNIPNIGTGHYEISVSTVLFHDYQYVVEWTYGGNVQYTPVITVLATDGEVGVTLYASVTEVNTILSTMLHTQAWDEASSVDRAKAISISTQAFELLNFSGFKTRCDQPLQFPRNCNTVIPGQIKRAIALNALALLSGVEPDREVEKIGVLSRGFSSVKTSYSPWRAPIFFLNGIASPSAWNLLQPYLADNQAVKTERVS